MFKMIVMIFAIHGGVAEPLQAFRNKQDFATEAACKLFMNSKEGKASKHRVEKLLAKQDEKLKAKFACIKEEEEKSGDDGSI
jgi:dihydroorotase-like cyclic amidohydrolase